MKRLTLGILFLFLVVGCDGVSPRRTLSHNQIRIPFEIDGRHYEAVGFLRKGETFVLGDEMFARTEGENGGAIGEDDWAFLRERLGKFLPYPSRLDKYGLVTNRHLPDYPESISCFSLKDYGWSGGDWDRWLYGRWEDNVLVLRRLP